jgi:hypothetical protein
MATVGVERSEPAHRPRARGIPQADCLAGPLRVLGDTAPPELLAQVGQVEANSLSTLILHTVAASPWGVEPLCK